MGYKARRIEILLKPATISGLRALAAESKDTLSSLMESHIDAFVLLERARRMRQQSHPLWNAGKRTRIVSHLTEKGGA